MNPAAMTDAATAITGLERRPAVAVGELKRAWSAVQAGAFRQSREAGVAPEAPLLARTRPATPPALLARGPGVSSRWEPVLGERVLPVLGCAGSVGTTTVALAIATQAAAGGTATRVVECCTVTSSGLAAASTAELGLDPSGWVQGTRDQVLLERASHVLVSVDEVPCPAPIDVRPVDLTVLDIGWEIGQLVATASWLGDEIKDAPAVVVVARPTIPSFRRLEGALELLAGHVEAGHVTVGVIGPRRRKWTKGVEHSAGPRTRAALDSGHVVEVPEDRVLAVAGLDSTPLPPGVLAAASKLLELTTVGENTQSDPQHDPDRGTPHDVDAVDASTSTPEEIRHTHLEGTPS